MSGLQRVFFFLGVLCFYSQKENCLRAFHRLLFPDAPRRSWKVRRSSSLEVCVGVRDSCYSGWPLKVMFVTWPPLVPLSLIFYGLSSLACRRPPLLKCELVEFHPSSFFGFFFVPSLRRAHVVHISTELYSFNTSFPLCFFLSRPSLEVDFDMSPFPSSPSTPKTCPRTRYPEFPLS